MNFANCLDGQEFLSMLAVFSPFLTSLQLKLSTTADEERTYYQNCFHSDYRVFRSEARIYECDPKVNHCLKSKALYENLFNSVDVNCDHLTELLIKGASKMRE